MVLAYQELIDKYPGTEYADFARKKLGVRIAKAPAPAPQQTQPAPVDTTSDTTTAPAVPSGIPRAPQPLVKGTFIYPQSQIESGIKGKVVLKIKIDFTGRVEEVIVLNSLDNAEIDEAAKNAALNTTFDPMDIDPMELAEGWFLYEVDVNPPQIEP